MSTSTFWSNEAAADMLPDLLRGLVVTIEVTLLAFVLSLVVGLILAVLRYLKVPVLGHLATAWVWFVRGTPILVHAFFVFFVLPDYGISMSVFTTGVIVLGLNYSAYTAEVYRGGIEGVPRGQWEAITALDLPARDAWKRIILPQAVGPTVPVFGNYLIQMFKDCAIMSAIGVTEMLSRTNNYQDQPVVAFTLVGLLYLVISYPSALLVRLLERRYAPSH